MIFQYPPGEALRVYPAEHRGDQRGLQAAAAGEGSSEVMIVESNIDDSTAEVLGHVMGLLLEKGALDVFFTPIQMKKNRPGVQLSFLCTPEMLDTLSRLVLLETSAIGLRHYPVGRMILERRIEERQTPFGLLRFKLIFDNGRLLRYAPEYGDCCRIARELGIPLQEVMRKASAALESVPERERSA